MDRRLERFEASRPLVKLFVAITRIRQLETWAERKSVRIAVIGSGISGMSAAWLMAKCHDVTLFESAPRLGGHSHTVHVPGRSGPVPVDTGFIVYNEGAYPNLTALFRHLDVPTAASNMSFSVSLDEGRLEYNGTNLNGLFAQRSNLGSVRFWRMLWDLSKFYRRAPAYAGRLGDMSLGTFIDLHGFGSVFRDEHLLPMASAIWSAPASQLLAYPAESFIAFCENHGLLKLTGRPVWRTVLGGSIAYVERMKADGLGNIRLGSPVATVSRSPDHATIQLRDGEAENFDAVVIATHADQALAMLADPTDEESELLGCFTYSRNEAVLHSDGGLMPRRRRAWASWNYRGESVRAEDARDISVTYWMNNLQPIGEAGPVFLTLNPHREPAPETVLHRQVYEHPVFSAATLNAQKRLWSLQGRQRTWFCGAHFGAGFHEDGLQAGLAVAEELGGVRRPWSVARESARIQGVARPRVDGVAA